MSSIKGTVQGGAISGRTNAGNTIHGFSPVANVVETEEGALITITDKIGTTSVTLMHGKDGVDGKDGTNGADGKDGVNGKDGADGVNGKDGANGKDGVDGKSAYEYAKDGGYTGTESEFATKMAELMTLADGNEVAY